VHKWYVLHVYSGMENKVAEFIREQAAKQGLSDKVSEISVPAEPVVEMRRGTKVNTERKFFPGYLLIKMELTDETLHLVKVPKVARFLGTKDRPTPISEQEAMRIQKQIADGMERPKSSLVFDIGEQVRVCSGPFATFVGLVEEVDDEKQRLKVSVSIFGRATPVDVEFHQVEKVR
jgi:transcriptional antiterminator NusG